MPSVCEKYAEEHLNYAGALLCLQPSGLWCYAVSRLLPNFQQKFLIF